MGRRVKSLLPGSLLDRKTPLPITGNGVYAQILRSTMKNVTLKKNIMIREVNHIFIGSQICHEKNVRTDKVLILFLGSIIKSRYIWTCEIHQTLRELFWLKNYFFNSRLSELDSRDTCFISDEEIKIAPPLLTSDDA